MLCTVEVSSGYLITKLCLCIDFLTQIISYFAFEPNFTLHPLFLLCYIYVSSFTFLQVPGFKCSLFSMILKFPKGENDCKARGILSWK